MSIYDITITALNPVAPGDGFIDYKRVDDYMATGAHATSKGTATAKSRGNRRYKNIVSILFTVSTFQILAVTNTGGDVDNPPTAITIRVQFDKSQDYLQTPDENNAGQTLTGALALKRIVARTLLRNDTTVLEIYDPTPSAAPGNTTQTDRRGTCFETTNIGPCASSLAQAEGAITVTQIA